jgi:hypothetical protein
LRAQIAATGRDIEPILLATSLPLTREESDSPGGRHISGRVLPAVPQVIVQILHGVCRTHSSFMVCNFGKFVAVAGLLDQRYTVRYPFSVTAEILELETGTRLRGATSELSLRGCFVRTTSLPESAPGSA